MKKDIRQRKQTLKTMRFGIEFELFTLDEQGYMTNGADRLIKRVKNEYPDIEIKRECAKNMIEITTPPREEVPHAMQTALEDYERVIQCAEKEKLILYSYGTYPGAFTPEFHSGKRYTDKEKIIGKQRFTIAGRCIGLHIHYSLPWGVFDSLERIIKPLIRSKNKESMVNIYNLCIAMDPALTTFAQSSPFYQGEKLGKDARMIAYRGGKELDYPQGLYANLPQFGALPNYKSTNTDILHVIGERFNEWTDLVKQFTQNVIILSKHGSILDNTWNPVKINAHGTMEVRGMDMNHPDIIIALAICIKYIIKAVQEKYIKVIPSDTGIEAPFKKEGNKIFIPPDSYVQNELQRKSAYNGLKDDAIYTYCNGFLKLAKEFVPLKKQILLVPLETMIETRQTTSDLILKRVKENPNYDDNTLTPAQAAELALKLSADLYNEVIFTKQRLIELNK
jgi:gamma-glutamyl:cysteine ligase YbdK (ATP-grasp superfamily)